MRLLPGDNGVIAQKLVSAIKVVCQKELEAEQLKLAFRCSKRGYVKEKCKFAPLVSITRIWCQSYTQIYGGL